MAGKRMLFASFLLFISTISTISAESCSKPEVQATSYTTQDATVLTNIAYVAEFSLKCSNGMKGLALYAEVNGNILPAARTSDDSHYQVSWTEEVKKSRSGDFNINLYDEEGFASLRKAMRNNEDLNTVKPVAAVILNHPGAYQGPWVNSEFMAAVLAVVVWYVAFSAKSKLLS